jgi:hypothetical protein
MLRTLAKAKEIGLDVTVSIPITHENVDQMDELIEELNRYRTRRIACFVPHSEGRDGCWSLFDSRWRTMGS